jgi:molybdenum cofactor guanylyltransferase
VEAAILAGGQARRLGGGDKAALVVAGSRILDRQIAILRPIVDRITIVGGRPEDAMSPDILVIPDDEPGLGPLGGIHTALVHMRTDRTLILACDMPFVTEPFFAWLGSLLVDADVVVPRDARGVHPLCAAWRVSAAAVVRRVLDGGARAVGAALDVLRVRYVEGEPLAAFDPHGWLLHNINTPDDYARAIGRR